ncbi:MAG TPA: S8 family serine peptidase, partial [Methanoregulaceae archaeon]|nr:S8 family serine peptidase [Methanoregulaceae archaeon]
METRPSSLFYHILLISFIVVIISIAFVPVALADQMGDMSGDHEIARGTTSSGETFYYVSNEVIVRYRPQLYNNTVLYQALSSEIARQINGSVSEDYGSMGLPGMQLIALSNGTTPERALAYYQNISYIEYAQYNYVEALPEPQPLDPGCKQPLMGSFLGGNLANYPNDPYFSQQWYLKKIDAPDAWTISTGSPDVEIAVLDSGIDINHPDLASNIDRARASSTVRDSHGTACAGVLAARGNNGIGITGVMWQARIVPIVVEDSNGYILSSYVISGLYQSHTYGAKIVSCSFGFLHNDLAMQDAFANSDALVICAAGNSGINDDIYPIYPAVYNLDNIISVAGTDQNDNLATFPGEGSSNYGVRTVDLAAPGIPILTTSTGNTYNEWQGTSFSAPMVAGVAGLIMSRHPGIGNAQVKAAILNNVDKIPSLKGKVVTGG